MNIRQSDDFAHFGDGNTARIIRVKRVKKRDGVRAYRFLFRVSTRIKDMYALNDDEDFDHEENVINREYPETEVEMVVSNPGYSRYWVFCDFNGEATPLSERDTHLKGQIKSLQRSNQSLQLDTRRTQEELEVMVNQKLKYLRGAVAMVNEARKGSKHVGDPENADDSSGEAES